MFRTAFFYHLLSSLILVYRAEIEYFESCAVSPESFFYKNGSFTHADTMLSSCQSSIVRNETYLTCSQASINDGSIGPQYYNASSPSDYYTWTNDNQIEFGFNQRISFTRFKVYFYVDQNANISLPKMRFLTINNGVIPNCTDSASLDGPRVIDALQPNELAAGVLNMVEVDLNGSYNRVLLCIKLDSYSLAMTEIKFCTTDSRTVSEDVTNISSTQESTAPVGRKTIPTILLGGVGGGIVIFTAIAITTIIIAKKLRTRYKLRHVKSQSQYSEH